MPPSLKSGGTTGPLPPPPPVPPPMLLGERCTRITCLVLKNNPKFPNYVIFFYEDDIQLHVQVPPRPTATRIGLFYNQGTSSKITKQPCFNCRSLL